MARWGSIRSHFLNAFSVVLPVFEQFVILAVFRSRNLIMDPTLRSKAQVFCAQEASHASQHRKYNQLLVRQGYSAIPRFEKALQRLLDTAQWWASRKWLLATAAGAEHVTAFMGQDFLTRPETWSRNTDPNLNALWKWHATEEVEHKAVCFDVYQLISGLKWRRRLALLLVSIPTLALVTGIQLYLLHRDGLLLRPGIWARYARFMLGRHGYLRQLTRQFWRYFRADFHPSLP